MTVLAGIFGSLVVLVVSYLHARGKQRQQREAIEAGIQYMEKIVTRCKKITIITNKGETND